MKIVITSHGDLCEGILTSYKMIAGDTSNIIAVKLDENGIGDFSFRLTKVLDEQISNNKAVIVLSDIMGGTPYNETLRYMLAHPDKVFLFAGLNLPMLIQAGTSLEESNTPDMLNSILEAGKTSVLLAPITINNDEDIDF
ncbi:MULTISPECIES: PTS sugar transporter subunit IIA [unclassified Gilliamella]|uniref:PTS sugar transporter subunit IIA n=1 Tax=unclassified Gilliamella TaxID=2685620 RepID=UPI00132738FA|nr:MULTISPECIES: PTS mannose transporter subunit IIAB [unclassified Gilliamella]MWN32452.1 PTS mannose transporter subunit IIAB [Gilliamella sp. Pra-s60]MWP29839.1 PTS mannose transporter subunit IIAB [Gilliamella sp. Pra-s54]